MNKKRSIYRLLKARKVTAGSDSNEDNKDYVNVLIDRSSSTGNYTLKYPGSFGPQVKVFKPTDTTGNSYAINFNSTAVVTLDSASSSVQLLWDEQSKTWR